MSYLFAGNGGPVPPAGYLPTRFQGAEAVGEVIDFMVPETSSTSRARDLLVRQARAVRGRATFELACHPAFDYGRAPHTVRLVTGVGAAFTHLALISAAANLDHALDR